MRTLTKIFAAALICVILAFSGCAASGSVIKTSSRQTEEDLLQAFLDAEHDKNYEAVWDLIPKQIQEYGIDAEIVKDREDGIYFAYYGANDYYWLRELDLPSHETFTFEVKDKHESDAEEAERIQKGLANEGVRIVIEAVSYLEIAVTADDTTVDAGIFMIKTGGEWYLTSVVGDDEMVKY